MKTRIGNYLILKKLVFISFFALMVLIMLSTGANAQVRRGHRGGSMHSSYNSIGHVGIRHGYLFAPSIGTRFRVLPFGYTSFWINGIPYYYYDDIYYQYYPADGVYVVVEKPDGVANNQNLKFDQVKLADGSTLEGIFESATDSTITLQIGNQSHNIDISDVVSINFASTVQDSTKTK